MESVLKKIHDKILHSILRESNDGEEIDSSITPTVVGKDNAIKEHDKDKDYVHLNGANIEEYSDDDDYQGSTDDIVDEIEADDEDENDNRLLMNIMSSQSKMSHKYRDSLRLKKVKHARYEDSNIDDIKLSRMILDYSKSIKRQDHYYSKIEKIYNKKHSIKFSIELIKIIDEIEGRMQTVINDKRWKRELIMKSINKELNKMIKDNDFNNFRDVNIEGQKIIREKSTQMTNIQRKHQKLIIDHEILQEENDELKRSYLDLKNRYELLLEERPDSSSSFNSVNSFGRTSSFNNNQKILKGLSIERGRKIGNDSNDEI